RCGRLATSPAARAWRQTSRRTSSRAPVAQETTWNGSAHRTACGARSATTPTIQSAPSAETWLSSAARSGPRRPEKASRVLRSRPGAAQISRPAVVIDHDDQVLMPAFIGDLVDPDAAQPGQAVGG